MRVTADLTQIRSATALATFFQFYTTMRVRVVVTSALSPLSRPGGPQTQVKVAGPIYHGCQLVTAAIDALAKLVTGSSRFHDQGTLGMPGEPNWLRDRQNTD